MNVFHEFFLSLVKGKYNICERIHLLVILLLTCQKIVSKVFKNKNKNDDNSNDHKVA